jgi:hypothetical protein
VHLDGSQVLVVAMTLSCCRSYLQFEEGPTVLLQFVKWTDS